MNENEIRVERTERPVKHVEYINASHESGGRKKIKNSFVLVRGESDGKKDVWAPKVIVLFRCMLRERSEESQLTFVQYAV